MPQEKIIVVFGSTGAQGGGAAHALLKDKGGAPAILLPITEVTCSSSTEVSTKYATTCVI